ncbi:hypothetical protein SEVIR_3G116000v4 [Setaria viridis]|uniref:Cathepsin propeptide inhibitor domain-containing protein n=3 Tax=Setaria TaxID=4554 RepID=A0A368QDR4_SETIT|nr:uncharacterized protein LOC101763618 [Setaria italica]XP_034584848.1 uncharacterized protein LOC117847701 [Setaria viridis]XP_034584849.1 uncharacterized protein LOC117847701 [Setaria viridis]XP_034584850.1 uncharacterized protein LOC117847701 [Setaria viridis]XP_034584852.1 uncharacterized protein LOC117847701 [Setaria viridis]RCV16137.1 hypothetical protein SETIT_3G113600v2 [Setaria italica]RCV16138.1 hypothetical protein SETIT_3G113600v2 [Setaria italica]TKW25386.1 hypothetical protein
MSLRSLGYLLIRRLSPRGICREQAQGETLRSVSGSLARSLHTLRDLEASSGAIGGLVAGGLATLVGILYFKKDESEVPDRKGDIILDETIRAKFMDEDGKFAWLEYIDYMNWRRSNPEVTDPEVLDKMLRRRYTVDDDEAINQDNVKIREQESMRVDDEAMKERFEDWMKEYDKTYQSEEEKVRRYEIFKKNAIASDKVNAAFPNGPHHAPNNLGDWTEEELYSLRSRQGDFPSESYFRRLSKAYAEGRVDGVPGIVDAHDEEVQCTEAVKQRFKELTARKAKQDAREAEQAAAKSQQDAREAKQAATKSQ